MLRVNLFVVCSSSVPANVVPTSRDEKSFNFSALPLWSLFLFAGTGSLMLMYLVCNDRESPCVCGVAFSLAGSKLFGWSAVSCGNACDK